MAKQILEKKEQGQQQRDTVAIEAEWKSLVKKINNAISELSEIAGGIQQSELNKEQAKKRYENNLDQGDEAGMKSALAAIRAANSQRQSLIESLSGFSEKVEGFRVAYGGLMAGVRACRSSASERLKVAQADYKNAELISDRCHGLLASFNAVETELSKIWDRIRSEEPAGKITDTMSDSLGNV